MAHMFATSQANVQQLMLSHSKNPAESGPMQKVNDDAYEIRFRYRCAIRKNQIQRIKKIIRITHQVKSFSTAQSFGKQASGYNQKCFQQLVKSLLREFKMGNYPLFQQLLSIVMQNITNYSAIVLFNYLYSYETQYKSSIINAGTCENLNKLSACFILPIFASKNQSIQYIQICIQLLYKLSKSKLPLCIQLVRKNIGKLICGFLQHSHHNKHSVRKILDIYSLLASQHKLNYIQTYINPMAVTQKEIKKNKKSGFTLDEIVTFCLRQINICECTPLLQTQRLRRQLVTKAIQILRKGSASFIRRTLLTQPNIKLVVRNLRSLHQVLKTAANLVEVNENQFKFMIDNGLIHEFVQILAIEPLHVACSCLQTMRTIVNTKVYLLNQFEIQQCFFGVQILIKRVKGFKMMQRIAHSFMQMLTNYYESQFIMKKQHNIN